MTVFASPCCVFRLEATDTSAADTADTDSILPFSQCSAILEPLSPVSMQMKAASVSPSVSPAGWIEETSVHKKKMLQMAEKLIREIREATQLHNHGSILAAASVLHDAIRDMRTC